MSTAVLLPLPTHTPLSMPITKNRIGDVALPPPPRFFFSIMLAAVSLLPTEPIKWWCTRRTIMRPPVLVVP